MSDEIRPPDWAWDDATDVVGHIPDDNHLYDNVARLLAKTRADAIHDLSRIFLAKFARHSVDFSVEGIMLDAVYAANEPS